MKQRTKRRIRQLAIILVGIPVAAWALEEAARRAEASQGPSTMSRSLRTGSEFLGQLGRGPLATRLRERRDATRTDGPRP